MPPRNSAAGSESVAVGLLVLCAISAFVIAVPRHIGLGEHNSDSIYDWSRGLIMATLALAALWIFAAPAGWRGIGYGVGLVAALQICGTGIVAKQHWAPYAGSGGGLTSYGHLRTLQALGVVLAVAGFAAAVGCGFGLIDPGAGRPSLSARDAATVVAGLVLIVVLPWLFGRGDAENLDLASLGGYAALVSLPIGLSLITAAVVPTRARLAIYAAIIGSCAIGYLATAPMAFQFSHADSPYVVAGAVAAALAIVTGAARRPG